MTKKRDEQQGVEFGPDELERRKPTTQGMTIPVDRSTPVVLPDPHITAAQAIEIFAGLIAPIKQMAVNVHEIVVGPLDGAGRQIGPDLVDRIAEKMAGKLLALFQSELQSYRSRLEGIATRVAELEANQHPGPNGSAPPAAT